MYDSIIAPCNLATAPEIVSKCTATVRLAAFRQTLYTNLSVSMLHVGSAAKIKRGETGSLAEPGKMNYHS